MTDAAARAHSTPSAPARGRGRRNYCPKCRGVNDRRDTTPGGRVCTACFGSPGGNFYCMVRGGEFPEGESLCWVCYVHYHTSGRPDSAPCGELEGRLYDMHPDEE